MRPLASLMTAFAVALVLLGCGGKKGGGAVVAPGVCVEFVPRFNPAPGLVVSQVGPGSGCDVLVVDVIVTGVTDVYGAEFVAEYDPDVLRYESYSDAESKLREGGVNIQTLVQSDPGRLTVGTSRVGAPAGADFVDPGLIFRMTFARRGSTAGDSRLDYSNDYLFGSETPPVVKNGIEIEGGIVRLR